jgi:hypothetical protein
VSQDYEEWARALFWEKAEMNYQSGMGAAKKALQAAKQEARDEKRGRKKAEQRAQSAEQRAAELECRLREAGL